MQKIFYTSEKRSTHTGTTLSLEDKKNTDVASIFYYIEIQFVKILFLIYRLMVDRI